MFDSTVGCKWTCIWPTFGFYLFCFCLARWLASLYLCLAFCFALASFHFGRCVPPGAPSTEYLVAIFIMQSGREIKRLTRRNWINFLSLLLQAFGIPKSEVVLVSFATSLDLSTNSLLI